MRWRRAEGGRCCPLTACPGSVTARCFGHDGVHVGVPVLAVASGVRVRAAAQELVVPSVAIVVVHERHGLTLAGKKSPRQYRFILVRGTDTTKSR